MTMMDLYTQYQSKLIYACLENFNVIDVMGGYAGGQFAKDNHLWWRASVEFLYRNLKSGLLEIDTSPEEFCFKGIDSLCRHYMETGPNLNDTSIYIYFCASEVLKRLVSKHTMMNWSYVNGPLNQNFIEDVKRIYSNAHVGFDEQLVFYVPTVLPKHPDK